MIKLFCKHKYELLNSYKMKSEFDIVNDSKRTPNSLLSLTRLYITEYACSKCGKIKRFTYKTPK